MEKTKFGISQGLLIGAVFAIAMISSWAGIVVALIVLYMEKSESIKKFMVKAIIFTISFAVVSEAVYVLSQLWSSIQIVIPILPSFTRILDYVINGARGVVYIIFIIQSLGIKDIKELDMDEQVNKHLD
ncbi:MAG: hypothetical protein HDR01_07695 [Lachnospiraceae bacterium]|nr:hypothetical protein [Lachnospiraceae bacterium]